MSKRVADGQGGSERYGGMDQQQDAAMDPPRKATAAQLAKRSIKPLKGRPSASRAASPSKSSAPSQMPNPFGAADGNPFAQSTPQPPTASSFNFGGSHNNAPTQPNPFSAMSTSQSFPPAAPTNNNNTGFAFGQSQPPAAAPSFAPPATASFSFGGPTNTGTSFSFGEQQGNNGETKAPSFSFGEQQSNGENKTPSFSFSGTPSPAPASPAATPSFGGFGAMSGGNQAQEGKISAADISEIEAAGPRLIREGKLEELADIVRHSDAQYKDANLANIQLASLPAKVQHQMLDYVRGNNNNNNKTSTPTPPRPAQTPSFTFGTAAATPAAPSTGFKFGASTTGAAQPESSPFKGFGGSASPAAQSPAPSFSFGQTADKTSAPPFGFGQTADKTSAPPPATSPFAFGGSTAKTDSTPATSSFTFGGSTESSSANTPAKPASSAFSFGGAAAAAAAPSPKPADKTSAPSFTFGTSTPASPSSAPAKEADKPSFGFGSPAPAPKAAEEVSYPKLNGASSQQPSAPSFSFSTTSATPAASPFKPSTTNSATESAFKPSTSFAASDSSKPQSTDLGPSMFSSSTPTQQKPQESAFKGFGASTTNQQSAFSSNFASSTPTPPAAMSAQAQPRAPQASLLQSRQPTGLDTLTAPLDVATPPASPGLQPSEMSLHRIAQLNDSFRDMVTQADSFFDWSSMARHYIQEVDRIYHENMSAPASDDAPKAITAAPSAPSASFARPVKRPADEDASKQDDDKRTRPSAASTSTTPQKPLSSTASLFDDILKSNEKPQAAPATNVFAASATKAPAAEPAQKSNPFASISRNTAPASDSSQAKSFVSTPFQTVPASVTPSTSSSVSAPSPSFPIPGALGTGAASPFKVHSNVQPHPPGSGAPSLQPPKFGAATGSTNFMSAFGKQAAAEEEKEREKRKLEDMDSDEDEEEWEKRDAEEQAKKKADLQAASQSLKFTLDSSKKVDSSASSVFSFAKPTSTPAASKPAASANIFGHLSGESAEDDDDQQTDEEDDEEPFPPASGKSLFDRTDKPSSQDSDKSATAPGTPFKFASFGASTSSPGGDQTWKENTPIKFGASTFTAGTTTPDGSPAKESSSSVFANTTDTSKLPPKFSFGAASTAATPAADKPSAFAGMFGAKPSDQVSKPATSSMGFQFGSPGSSAPSGLAPPSGTSIFASATTSRATTPGAATTTDAENSAAESEPSDTPKDAQTDLTALTSEELSSNTLLLESRTKATKFVKDADPAWQAQGVGPIRLLKSKDTGKPRILMRASPSGKIVLNFSVVLNKAMYTHKGGKNAQVLVPTQDKKMETFLLMFKEEAGAKGFVEKVHEAIDGV